MRKKYAWLVGLLCFSLLVGSGCSTFKKWLGMEKEKEGEKEEEIVTKQDTSKVCPALVLPKQQTSAPEGAPCYALSPEAGGLFDPDLFRSMFNEFAPPFGNPVKVTKEKNPEGEGEIWTFPDGTTATVVGGTITYEDETVITFTKNSDGSVTYTYPGKGILTVKTDGTWNASITEDGSTITASGVWKEDGSGSCTINIPADPTTGLSAGQITWTWQANGAGTLQGSISVDLAAQGMSGTASMNFALSQNADGSKNGELNYTFDISYEGYYTMEGTMTATITLNKNNSGSMSIVLDATVDGEDMIGTFAFDFDSEGQITDITEQEGVFAA